ncbi:LpqB family beta-propeller domain-containing protein [Frigoribacterium sp. ME-P-080]|uniref:LpqB family beta-propeller domain-containing protein n=1 Tax=Frigoribacterium sp. ME-P-080 TaxID=3040289 RepID=UPI00254EEF00|nr:LpqB family beta-propeller domain-containing protein [Frigoribacterium sp. ME-P-080]
MTDPRRNARRGRRSVVLAALVGAAITLTGCVGIPDAGQVQQGDTVSDDVVSDFVFRPNGPVAGSSQERLLRDFLSAGTGSQDNYGVARQFLSTGFADEWEPRASVTIRPGVGSTSRVGGSTLDYAFVGSATVDSAGHYTPATSSTTTSLAFSFVREGGEWRISDAPDGIVLSPATFDSVFRSHAAYFYDPTFTYLVPDERWFLARSSTSTRLATALLDGPSDWLQGAVVSAFPEGTQLSLTAITVDDGTARVDLTADALEATPAARARMQAQLLASFSTLATVTAVELSVEGAPLSVPAMQQPVPVRDPAVDARPLVLADGVLGFATSSATSQLPGLSDAVEALRPRSVELSADQTAAAVGTSSGAYAVTSQGGARLVDARTGLVAPSLDDAGFVWSLVADDPTSLTAYALDGTPHPVVTSLPAGPSVTTFRISRDGTRALLLLDDQGESRLLVAAVVRDADGVPLRLGPTLELSAPDGAPVDATWADQLTVAVLTTVGESSRVTMSEVGGDSSSAGRPSGEAVAIVGGNGFDRLLLLGADGDVLEPRGSSWQATGLTADLVATQR